MVFKQRDLNPLNFSICITRLFSLSQLSVAVNDQDFDLSHVSQSGMVEVADWSNDKRLAHAKKLLEDSSRGPQKTSGSGKRKRESSSSTSSKSEEQVIE